MAFDKSYRTPAVLTGIARGVMDGVFGASVVSQYLPMRENRTLTFDFQVDQTTLPRAASFRSWNTEADVTVAAGAQSRQGKLPPISRRYNIDEYSHLVLTGGDLGAEFEAKTSQIAAEIAVRFVEGAAEAIETGKMQIDERNLSFEIDYGRKAALTATAPVVWSDPAADVIADLEALRAAYGSNPGTVMVPWTVQQHLSRNTSVIKFALGRGTDLPAQVSYADALSVLANFGFTGIVSNDERLIDHNGVERTLFSQEKVIFLPGVGSNALAVASGAGALGSVDLGVTAESLSSENGVGGTAGAFAGALASHNPEGYDVLVSAIGLPILQNANATAALQVL